MLVLYNKNEGRGGGTQVEKVNEYKIKNASVCCPIFTTLIVKYMLFVFIKYIMLVRINSIISFAYFLSLFVFLIVYILFNLVKKPFTHSVFLSAQGTFNQIHFIQNSKHIIMKKKQKASYIQQSEQKH
jgi:hypothetical protein